MLVVTTALTLGILTRPIGWCSFAGAPSRGVSVVRRAASASTVGGTKFWKEAHSDAKGLEEQLRKHVAKLEDQVKKLDTTWVEELPADFPAIPPVPQRMLTWEDKNGPDKRSQRKSYNRDGTPRPDTAQDFFDGKLTGALFETPAHFRDLDENPPILSFAADIQGKIVGAFSENSDFAPPARLYPVQLTAGAGDDPASSDKENTLWRESLDQVVESMETLWPKAEAAMAALKEAEVRFEARQPKPIQEWRKRVMNAIEISYKHPLAERGDIDLEEMLTVVSTNSRMRLQLANLEEYTLELEGLRNEMKMRRGEASEFKEETDDHRRKMRKVWVLEDNEIRVTSDIRSVCESARDMVASEQAMKLIGDEVSSAFNSLNPFQ